MNQSIFTYKISYIIYLFPFVVIRSYTLVTVASVFIQFNCEISSLYPGIPIIIVTTQLKDRTIPTKKNKSRHNIFYLFFEFSKIRICHINLYRSFLGIIYINASNVKIQNIYTVLFACISLNLAKSDFTKKCNHSSAFIFML